LNPKSRFSSIALGLLLVNLLMLENILLKPAFLRQNDSAAWRTLYTYVANSQRVVNSPVVVSALIGAGILPVDSGQTEYYYSIHPYADNILLGPNYEALRANGIAYRHSLQEAVRNRQFDRIFTTNEYGNLIAIELIRKYYTQVDALTIEMPQTHQTWIIGVWEPQGK
jgi:adenosyl cobinamide kinase/adenosyl cobinamide phosphate guanylyltransferase